MLVHPAIAALRSNRPSQRSNQRVMDRAGSAWLASNKVRALASDLADYGAGAQLDACIELGPLLSHHAVATGFTDTWRESMLGALSQSPLGEVPFRHRYSNGYSTVRLLTHGSATLSLSAYERRAVPSWPDTALFVDREAVELVLTGQACGTFHRLQSTQQGAQVQSENTHWRAGDRIVTLPSSARQFVEVAGSMVVLQLSRAPHRPAPTREYRLSDSALIKSASGDKTASRDMLALGVLGALAYSPSLDAMERTARDDDRAPDLRWEAVRQSLALDPARGFAMLNRLAERAGDELREPAKRLRHQLLMAHPQLAAKDAA